MHDTTIDYRRAWPEDARAMAEFRCRMFEDMGLLDGQEAGREDFLEAAERFYSMSLGSNSEYTVIGMAGDEAIACGTAQFQLLPPRPKALDNLGAYVLSVYVSPEFRHRGIARSIMEAIHAECARRKVFRVSLHASDAGKPLYEKLGYEGSPKYLEKRF